MRDFPTLPEWVKVEHQVAEILTRQEIHGWSFNKPAAYELESAIRTEMEELVRSLRSKHPFVAGAMFTPKRDNRTLGYVAGCESTRLKETNFQSRDHIAWILTTHYGWKASSMTATGKPVIDETVLKSIGQAQTGSITDISAQFLRLMELQKLLGMISVGANAWLKLCTTSNRIHHHCSVGCATFRASHRSPNLAQVPSDPRCRELFTASEGLQMVGADLSSIELRLMAHYLARWDGGRYRDILLNGDIHQVNADKVGVSRSAIKTITYAFLYGCGDIRLGLSYDKSLSEKRARAKGKEIRRAYVDAIEGLSELLTAVKDASERGFVKAIDGRKILVDSKHKALNFLLQGSAACVAKMWMLLTDETIKEQGIRASQLAFIHDELQFECAPEDVNELRTILEQSARAAGERYKLRVPIAAESKTGSNWSEVH